MCVNYLKNTLRCTEMAHFNSKTFSRAFLILFSNFIQMHFQLLQINTLCSNDFQINLLHYYKYAQRPVLSTQRNKQPPMFSGKSHSASLLFLRHLPRSFCSSDLNYTDDQHDLAPYAPYALDKDTDFGIRLTCFNK